MAITTSNSMSVKPLRCIAYSFMSDYGLDPQKCKLMAGPAECSIHSITSMSSLTVNLILPHKTANVNPSLRAWHLPKQYIAPSSEPITILTVGNCRGGFDLRAGLEQPDRSAGRQVDAVNLPGVTAHEHRTAGISTGDESHSPLL